MNVRCSVSITYHTLYDKCENLSNKFLSDKLMCIYQCQIQYMYMSMKEFI